MKGLGGVGKWLRGRKRGVTVFPIFGKFNPFVVFGIFLRVGFFCKQRQMKLAGVQDVGIGSRSQCAFFFPLKGRQLRREGPVI